MITLNQLYSKYMKENTRDKPFVFSYVQKVTGLHVFCKYISSNYEHEKKIHHKIHICNLSGLHEL